MGLQGNVLLAAARDTLKNERRRTGGVVSWLWAGSSTLLILQFETDRELGWHRARQDKNEEITSI